MTTRLQIEVLNDVANGQNGRMLHKDWFDAFPRKLTVAKGLLWGGYLESTGEFGERIRLTPAGTDLWSRHFKNSNEK